jgi:hypothetical protein
LETFSRYADLESEAVLEGGLERIDEMMADIEDEDDRASDRHASPTAPISPSTNHLASIFDDVDE